MSIELPKMPEPFVVVDRGWLNPNEKTLVPAFTADQLRAYAQEASRLALEAAANVCDEIYHNYACDESAGECVKAIRALAAHGAGTGGAG